MPKLSGATNLGRSLDAAMAKGEESRCAPLALEACSDPELLQRELLALRTGEIEDPDGAYKALAKP